MPSKPVPSDYQVQLPAGNAALTTAGSVRFYLNDAGLFLIIVIPQSQQISINCPRKVKVLLPWCCSLDNHNRFFSSSWPDTQILNTRHTTDPGGRIFKRLSNLPSEMTQANFHCQRVSQ